MNCYFPVDTNDAMGLLEMNHLFYFHAILQAVFKIQIYR